MSNITKPITFWVGVAALVALGILAYVLNETVFQPLPIAQASEVVELKNGDSYDMTAYWVEKEINGKTYRMLSYNGTIPGPMIKVAQGAEITVNFRNKTNMKTLLHSHGVRMENAFDGSQTTQEEMEPGELFSYRLKFSDAGMFWYHPHVREDYEQELGLYGNYLVVPASNDYWSPVNREVALFLDDILIENGKINLSERGADRTLMGRFGNVMLVNGETDYWLATQKGEVIRFYVTNAANTRPFNFAIEGARMKLVGGDGGAYESDSLIDSVILGPSERAVVEVLFEESGTFSIEHRTPNRTYKLGSVIVGNAPTDVSYANDFAQLKTHQETVQSIDPFRPYFTVAPDKRISLTVDMMGMSGMGGHMPAPYGTTGSRSGMPDGTMMGGMGMMGGVPEGGIEWEDEMGMMNAMSDTDSVQWHIVDQDTGKRDMGIDWTFARSKLVKIRIFNDPKSAHPMQHPIHFHGQRFLVVARDGAAQTNLVWKDTVMVKAGETVDIVLDTSNPGTWMAHCHIAEHLEAGMMMKFTVQ
ncbi:MAG: multicopper oxidase family protein [Patescibacteria group bacterium]